MSETKPVFRMGRVVGHARTIRGAIALVAKKENRAHFERWACNVARSATLHGNPECFYVSKYID